MTPAQVFVGRAAELRALSTWRREAFERGKAQVVLVEGTPGVGKTRLAERIAQDAARSGARVSYATCQEGLDIPYLPIASLLRPLLHDERADRALTGPEREVLAPFSVASTAVPGGDGQVGLRRLFLAAARLLIGGVAGSPTLLVLEDVHWADGATLDLLGHLIATASHEASSRPVPLMVVLTSRPLRRSAPKSLERLHREPGARAIHLGPMSEIEVNQLMVALRGTRPTTEDRAAVMEASGGNPALVQALVARMARGEPVGEHSVEIDEELAERLAEVDETCRAMLIRAALLGGAGPLQELQAVSELDGPGFEEALSQADEADLLTDDGATYRFRHSEVQRALATGLGPRRARQFHIEIADRLEELYGDESSDHALRIVGHLRKAGRLADDDRLLRYGREAADRAAAAGAWTEAVRAYTLALDAVSRLTPGEPRPVELLERAAWAHFHDFQIGTAIDLFAEGVEIAIATDDRQRWAGLVLGLVRARLTEGAAGAGSRIDASPLERFLTATGDGDEQLRAGVLALLAEVRFAVFDYDGGLAACDKARRLNADDDQELASALDFAEGLQHLGRLDVARARALFADTVARAQAHGDRRHEVWALGRGALAALLVGDLEIAERQAVEAARVSTSEFRWAELSLVDAVRVGVAVAQGRFADVEGHGVESLLAFHRSDYPYTLAILFPQIAAARALRGDTLGAHEALDEWEALGGRGTRRYRLLCDVLADDREAVEKTFDPAAWAEARMPVTLFGLTRLTAQVEIADFLDLKDLADAALSELAELERRGVLWCTDAPLFVPRLLGVAASLTGAHVDADRYFTTAAARARRARARAEIARIHLSRSRAEVRDGSIDTVTIVGRLRLARSEFDDLGMLPYVRQASDLERALSDPESDPGRSLAVRVLLFTDLVGSTGLNVRAGDARYFELLSEHNRIVRSRLGEFDGVQFKHTGDGICAWFSRAAQAMNCALMIQHDLDVANAGHPELALSVRCGLAAGEPIVEGNDLFGLAVARAARVCAHAEGGQVLLASEVVALGGLEASAVRRLGDVELRGIPEPVTLYEARPRA